MLAGYRWMTADGSVRAVESAKSRFTPSALIGFGTSCKGRGAGLLRVCSACEIQFHATRKDAVACSSYPVSGADGHRQPHNGGAMTHEFEVRRHHFMLHSPLHYCGADGWCKEVSDTHEEQDWYLR
jgi:hypothetical protein